MSNKRVINMIVDHESRTIRPKNYEEFIYILSFFENKSEVTITIEPYIRKVEQTQMGYFHVLIKMIHEETGDDKVSIKTDLKERFGVRLDDGNLKSTASYSTTEMNKLIEGTVIFMTQFLNMSVPNPEEFKKKNIK